MVRLVATRRAHLWILGVSSQKESEVLGKRKMEEEVFIQKPLAETRTAVLSIFNAQWPSQLTTVMTHCHSCNSL